MWADFAEGDDKFTQEFFKVYGDETTKEADDYSPDNDGKTVGRAHKIQSWISGWYYAGTFRQRYCRKYVRLSRSQPGRLASHVTSSITDALSKNNKLIR